MERSSRRVADLSDRVLHIMRQWGATTIEELETELLGTERPLLEAAMKRLVELQRIKAADPAGVYRPR